MESRTTVTTRTTTGNSVGRYDAAVVAEAARQKRIKEQQAVIDAVKQVTSKVIDASKDILTAKSIIGSNMTGEFCNVIKNVIDKALDGTKNTISILNSIGTKAAEKIRSDGEACTYDELQPDLNVIRDVGDRVAFSCDTNLLREQVLPQFQNAEKKLTVASAAGSGLVKLEGSGDATNVSQGIDDEKNIVRYANKKVEEFINNIEQMEKDNVNLIEKIGDFIKNNVKEKEENSKQQTSSTSTTTITNITTVTRTTTKNPATRTTTKNPRTTTNTTTPQFQDIYITNFQPKNNSDIAHRGYTPGGIYDNSAEGFILAGENGFWGCETDVRFDLNGNLVCSHNTVKNGQNPTSFEEYLDICKKYGMAAIIDLKYEKGVGPADPNLSPAILKMIQEKGMMDSCILQTNNPTDIPYIRENSKDARIWYLTDVISDKNVQLIEENNVECVNILSSENNSYRIKKLIENEIDVCVWNVQTEALKQRLLNMGAKYIMSDNVLGITPYQEGEEDFNDVKGKLKDVSAQGLGTTKPQDIDNSKVNQKWEEGYLDYVKGILDYSNGEKTIRETWCDIEIINSSALKFTILENGKDEGYWLREDGVEMFGEYVCVASDIGAWFGDTEGAIYNPTDKCETSMGTAIVMDYCGMAVKTRKEGLKNKNGEVIDIWYDIYAKPNTTSNYTEGNRYYQSHASWEAFFKHYPSKMPETPEPVTDWEAYFRDPDGYFGNSNNTTDKTVQLNSTKPNTTTDTNSQLNSTKPNTTTDTNSQPNSTKPNTTTDTNSQLNSTKPNTTTSTTETTQNVTIPTRTTTKPNPTIETKPSIDEKPTKPSMPSMPSISEPNYIDIPVMKCTPEAVLKVAKNMELIENDSHYLCKLLHLSGYLTEGELNIYIKWDINEICKQLDKRGWDKITNISELKEGDIIIVGNGEEVRVYAGNNSWYTAGEKAIQQGDENWAVSTNWVAYRQEI